MKRLDFLSKSGSLKIVSTVGAVLTPFIDNRFVPYPYFMTFVVTRRCNSRCQMCGIWKDKTSPFLSLGQIEGIFSQNDFSFVRILTLTGGEPTLRSDLPELFALSLKHMPNLEYVSLATSGLNTHRTKEHVARMLAALEKAGKREIHFEVQISLDGVGDIHDTIRGIDGFFEKVQRTLAQLRSLQERFPQLRLRLSCVVMPYNLPHMTAVREFSQAQNLPIHYSPVVLSGEYYENLHGANDLAFSNGSHEQANQFFAALSEESQTSYRFYYRDMAQMVQGQSRSRKCMMGFYGFVLEHDGHVYPCVNCEKNSFGNLLTDSFETIWFGDQANEARRALRTDCCPTCTSVCYPQPVNMAEVTEIYWRRLQQRFK